MARRPSNLPYLATSVLALAIILAAWIGRDRFQPLGPGSPAPHFEAETFDGGTASIDDFRGRVVLLNVWATWCPPCVYEMPSMQRLYDELDEDDFEIVAVSVDARGGQAGPLGYRGGDPEAFADSLNLEFPILWDPQGTILRDYEIVGLPESYLIGRDGLIYRKVSGPTEWDHPEYIRLVRRLLDQEG